MTVTLTTKQIAAALRLRVLTLNPENIGINNSVSECPPVWGVVVETAHPDAVASLVALADGSVSLYVSDGNGCIGCGAHREIRWAAADLLQVAEKALPLAMSTADLSLPPDGYVRCYLLTPDGLRSVQVKLEDTNTKMAASFGTLYFAAQRVISAIERLGAGQSLSHEMKIAIAAPEGGSMQPEATSFVKDEPRTNLQSDSPQIDSSRGSSQCLSVGNVVLRLRT